MFAYDPAIIDRFPATRGGLIHATGVSNGPSSPDLLDAYRAQQAATAERLRETPIAEWPSIAAWRRVFAGFGAKPTQYRNAAESLLRRLDKQGDIPSIATLVDLGNLVAIRYGLPVAVFDLARVTLPITVRFAAGDETFADLGSSESVRPEAGEVVFIDAAGAVHARRWCWRQSANSAARPDTTEVLITVEGHHDRAAVAIDAALADLTVLLREYFPTATAVPTTLSATRPSASSD
ncbi:MAG TPA: phenylalanine--tRNA ligase beta subunit-related protein [Thermomicrobiales bacterium]|jgi:DNA/RNA-binding domain of Phe-tRNA-synthetase-like protein|nr:phenylalanine--tRNA ligase beta subunit-related protein [Thermomicrobiales bacterium]